jgi:hypothetical protein
MYSARISPSRVIHSAKEMRAEVTDSAQDSDRFSVDIWTLFQVTDSALIKFPRLTETP